MIEPTIHEEESNRITPDDLAAVRPFVVSVIGPTNEGKTSVLRTLTGNPHFGEISVTSGTTAFAEYLPVEYRKEAEILRLIDTPGFQMSSEILRRLESAGKGNEFTLDDLLGIIPKDDRLFLHDRRAWTETAKSDLILFIANVSESPDSFLLRDTLTLLTRAGKPVLVVFNNIAAEDVAGSTLKEEADYHRLWRETLRKLGLHLSQDYDAHRRLFRDEKELFEKISVHITDPLTLKIFRAEIRDRIDRERKRVIQSRQAIAELLLDIAACQLITTNVSADPVTKKETAQRMAERLAELTLGRENDTHCRLLEIWGFSPGILDRKTLKSDGEIAENDHFFGERIVKQAGNGAMKGAGIGAGIGLLLDVALAGLSLGTGTAIGGAIGGFIGGLGGGYYNVNWDKKRKILTLHPTESFLDSVLRRGVFLTARLRERGQALEMASKLPLSTEPPAIDAPEIAGVLKEIRRNSALSDLTETDQRRLAVDLEKRGATIRLLTDLLADAIPLPDIA